jgi:hypothetical protein
VPVPVPDVCVFCGTPGAATPEGRLTREHAFPMWSEEELRPAMGETEIYLDGRLQPQYAGMEVEIEAVCRQCNNEWLSNTFEKKVAKWLRPSLLHLDQGFILDQHQRALVAAWAVKTGLLVELALGKIREPAFTPKRHFDWLYEHREPPRDVRPPPSCTVWMFGVNVTSSKVGLVKAMLVWAGAHSVFVQSGEGPKGYFTTFTLGHLGFQVLGWDLDESDLVNPSWPVRPRMPDAIQEGVRQLHPAPRKPPLRWPWLSAEGGVILTTRDNASMDLLARWPWEPRLTSWHREYPAQKAWTPSNDEPSPAEPFIDV